MESKKRLFGPDLLRVIACYLVVQVHAGEFFYIGENGTVIFGDAGYWVNLFNSVGRAAVPLFIMITGYFVLPIKDNMPTFFKKRFTRVVIPFIIWCVIYAFYKFFMNETDLGTTLINILKIPVNFGTEVGHLWYIYMLIGLYLFFPLISPWLKTASKKALHFYLILWGFSLFLPYIHQIFPEVLGECFWNNTPLMYYFSGFLGFAITGFYMKKFHADKKRSDLPIGILLLVSGYLITALVFRQKLSDSTPFVSDLELSWGYGTINVAAMALGLFFLFKNVKCNGPVNNLITSISNMSYGIYFVHIMILNFFYGLFNGMEILQETYIKLPLITICTFICSYIVIKLISYIPKSKYIIG